MTDDDWGCIFYGAILIGGAIWAYNKYEIKEREPPKVVLPSPAPSAPARPTGQVQITRTVKDAVWSVDADTVRGDPTARVAWVNSDHSADKSVAWRMAKTLYMVNCDTNQVKELSFLAYDAKDQLLQRYEFTPDEAKPHYYPPESVGGAVPREICKPIYDKPAK